MSIYSSTAAILAYPAGEPISHPNGRLRQPVSLADSTGITIPSSAWIIPPANGHDQPAGVGHNSGDTTPMADDTKAAKAAAIAEIQAGLISRLGPTYEYMTAAEIGAAPNRGVLLKRAQIDGLGYLSRALDALDPDPEGKRRGTTIAGIVFSLDCIFSDNPNGCSTVPNRRIAGLLGVGERVVRYARNLLVELRVTFCSTIPGIGNAYHPIFSKQLTAPAIQVTWWLDATSEPGKRGWQAGRQRGEAITPAPSVLGLSATITPAQSATPAPSVPELSSPEAITPARCAITPARPFGQPIENKRNAGRYSTNRIHKEDSLSPSGEDVDASLFSDAAPSKGAHCKPSKPDVDAALAAYVETAKRCGLRVPRKPEVYLDAVAVRLREGSLDEWREMLGIVERSPHLLGENERRWKASLDWLAERKNYAKVLDGKYLRDRPKPKPISRYGP